jgi:hypothetical protein
MATNPTAPRTTAERLAEIRTAVEEQYTYSWQSWRSKASDLLSAYDAQLTRERALVTALEEVAHVAEMWATGAPWDKQDPDYDDGGMAKIKAARALLAGQPVAQDIEIEL